MARQARGEYLNPHEVQVVHTVQRCVRQAFLKRLGRRPRAEPASAAFLWSIAILVHTLWLSLQA